MKNNNFIVESVEQHHDVIQFLEERLYDYNSSNIKKHNGSLFSKVIRDRDGNIIASISGWIWANACEITLLWVKEDYRKIGLGKKLLKAAEGEVMQKGCKTILLRSYSFQAPMFYEKNGYKTEHILKNFPEGHKYYTLVKRL